MIFLIFQIVAHLTSKKLVIRFFILITINTWNLDHVIY
jgi:hypothetical protein